MRRLLVGPDIPIAVFRVRTTARLSKPWMPVGSVIDHQIHDDAYTSLVRPVRKFDEIAQRAVARIHPVIVRDIISIVAAGRRLKRHQPDRRNPEPVQIVQTAHEPLEIADSVPIGIHKSADGKTIDHRALIPKGH